MGVAGWTNGYLGLVGYGGFVAAGIAAFASLLWRRRIPRRAAHAPAARPDERRASPAAEAQHGTASGVDIHLVMNTFNRLVGEEGEQSDQILDLCDYLRQTFLHALPAEVGLEEEMALVGAYLRLAARFRGCSIEAEYRPGADLRTVRLQAHSLCRVAQTLFSAFPVGTPGRWAMPLRIAEARRGGIEIDMCLQAPAPQSGLRLRRAREEMRSLCDAMSQQACRWTCRIVRRTDASLAAVLWIR